MNLRSLTLSAAAATLAIGMFATIVPASAQMAPQTGDPYCGSWVAGMWTPNGNCDEYLPTMKHGEVSGTITSVKGHLVTLQQTAASIVIDDTPALRRQTSGRVAVGRRIDATGYWRNGTFYATNIN